jgi:AcrR family transcriptional regulator
MTNLSAANTGAVPEAPSRVRRERLTREQILATALRMVDSQGIEALTMRRLGHELGRDAMSLYRYVPNRAALVDGVMEAVMDELVVRGDDDGDWQSQLRCVAQSFRELALAHPHVVALIIVQPLSTPLALRPRGSLRLLEELLALLGRAGFDPELALRVAGAYLGTLFGHLLAELQRLDVKAEESDPLLRLGLHRLPPSEFPQVRGLAPQLAGFDGAAELHFRLSVLFSGLDREVEYPRA